MPAAEAALPLADGELDALFAALAGADIVALAVSGGTDSLALLDCIDRWRKLRCGPRALVLTVDHRLRPEAADEAAGIAVLAAARGMEARVLTWDGPHPAHDIEAAARAARYRLLLAATRAAGARHLVTAHQREDQAETFLMRLSRGSGVFGLAAMRPAVEASGVTILRPFLDVPRARLAATVTAAGLVPANDPMNDDPRFLRVAIRRALPALAAAGIDAEAIAATAARLREAADAIDTRVSDLIGDAVRSDRYAVIAIDPSRFAGEEPAVRQRLLVRVLMAVGGEPYPPRSDAVAALDGVLASGAPTKRTLAGAIIERSARRGIVVYREAGRNPVAEIPAPAGFAGEWDHRFQVEIGVAAPSGLTLGALGESGRLAIGARAGPAAAGALAMLPALRLGGRVVAVPSLEWRRGAVFPAAVLPILDRRLAAPQRFPAAFPG